MLTCSRIFYLSLFCTIWLLHIYLLSEFHKITRQPKTSSIHCISLNTGKTIRLLVCLPKNKILCFSGTDTKLSLRDFVGMTIQISIYIYIKLWRHLSTQTNTHNLPFLCRKMYTNEKFGSIRCLSFEILRTGPVHFFSHVYIPS